MFSGQDIKCQTTKGVSGGPEVEIPHDGNDMFFNEGQGQS